MSASETDTAREELITLVLGARSLPQIEWAERELRQWLLDHPQEQGMRDGFEQLSHMRDFAEWLEANPEEAKAVRARDHARDLVYDARTTAEAAAAREALCQCVRDFPDDDMASDFHFLALWEESIAFMEREGASWEMEPEKVPVGV